MYNHHGLVLATDLDGTFLEGGEETKIFTQPIFLKFTFIA